MLLPRVLTAAVGIPVFLYLIELGGIPFIALSVGLAVLALHEYATVLHMGGRGVQRVLTVLAGALACLSVALSGRAFPGEGLTGLALTAIVASVVLRELLRKEHSLDRAALTLFGTFFIGWTLGHLVLIRDSSADGKLLTFMLFSAVWGCDILAYTVGLTVGRRRLAEVISPKKSWEGTVGGLLGAVAVVWIFRTLWMPELALWKTWTLALLIGVVGQLSDLSQSLVKRASGVKDSGGILPGHGGVFDRMDSFFLLAPLYHYFLLMTR
ncbi:MAG TPA: phosphatidate cytidylyltransferase [Elusimicrobia bacterium]|nr:phosphatidate cytidylyltransferase [Elusimicrobiota bacterium]